MMRQMRENTKWIMLVTALAFVALMVFEWGMDATGRTAGGVGAIGTVDGTPIMYEEYMQTYRNLYDQAQAAQEEPITSQQVTQIEDQAFEQVVTQKLIRQELDRRGISVTDAEVRQAALYSPPPEFMGMEAFRTEGAFDPQKYQQYITSPQADEQILQYLESYYRDLIPRSKLLRQVTTGTYLTDQELWRRWRERNETVEIRYIPFDPLTRIPDDSVTVTDEEIETYYEENQEDFEVPARASVRVAVLRKAPTASDTAAARARTDSAISEIRAGTAFADVASREIPAQDTLTGEPGDLGVVRPGELLPPVDSAAFQGPVGAVQGPIQTARGFHLLEVRERWAADSARVGQIVIPIERTDDSEIELLTRVDSLEDMIENRPLEAAASELDVPVQTQQISEDFAFVQGAGQISEGQDWVFEEGRPGDVSPIFENSQAFYALELVESTPAGVVPLEDARGTIRQILLQDRKVELAEERARSVVERIRASATLPDAAAEAGLEVRHAGPFSRLDQVPGIGRQNKVIGTAFGLDEGEVSDPVRTARNVFIVQQMAHTPADSANWLEAREAQRNELRSLVRQERLQRWIEGLRAQANVVDRRDEVLGQPEEEEGGGMPGGGFGF